MSNPYIGIIVFIVLPTVFFIGLALIPLGVSSSNRRVRKGLERIVVDREKSLQRLAMFFIVTTLANILIASQLTYRAVAYMDTDQFCGQSCHVMHPQFRASLASAHSNVACADCHIAPGAAGWFHAKMNGTGQLFEVVTNTYPRPIPPPIQSGRLLSADETCLRCHAFRNSGAYRLRVVKHYSDDETPKPLTTVLMMRIGDGTSGGIRGVHLAPGVTIRYAAKDARREEIPWVEYRNAKTNIVRTYNTSDGTPAEIASLPKFQMQCVDCHSQPAHTMEQPGSAVDSALAAGSIPVDLPFIRQKSIELLKTTYLSQKDAAAKISEGLTAFYRQFYPAAAQRSGDVTKATQEVVAIYQRNVSPEMKITWGTYPQQLGHTESAGCFRCHDGAHTAAHGKSIVQDCNTCHVLIAMADPSPKVLETLGIVKATRPEATQTAGTAVTPNRADPLVTKGKGIYEAQSCNACHGDAGMGTAAGSKLIGIGTRDSKDQLIAVLKSPTPKMIAGGMSPLNLPGEQMDALVAYLGALDDVQNFSESKRPSKS